MKEKSKGSYFFIMVKLVLTVVCISIFLTSCGTASLPKIDKQKPVSLTIWHHYIGLQKEAMDELISEFNSTAGREIGIIVNAFSMDYSGDIHNEIMQAANKEPGAREMPDIATLYPGTAYTLYQMKLLAGLDKYINEDELDKYVDSFLEEGRLTNDSGLIIFPTAKSTEVLMINDRVYKQFLIEYNGENPQKPLAEEMLATFEGLLETAEAYYNWTNAKTPTVLNDGKALFGFDAVSNFSVIGYRQMGKEFLTIKDKKGSIDLGLDAMQKIWDNYYIPMSKGYYSTYSQYRSEDVQTGDLVMYVGSTAGAGFFPHKVTYRDNTQIDTELKVLPYPVLKDGKKMAVQQGAGMVVTKSTPEKEYAATVFLKWFTEPQRNTRFVLATGYLPVTKEALDNTLPVELDKIKGNPDYENVAKVITQALNMRKDYEFYTYKPFEHSDDFRNIFENAILEASKQGRERFVESLKEGRSFDEAVKDNISDNTLNTFIYGVKSEINKVE